MPLPEPPCFMGAVGPGQGMVLHRGQVGQGVVEAIRLGWMGWEAAGRVVPREAPLGIGGGTEPSSFALTARLACQLIACVGWCQRGPSYYQVAIAWCDSMGLEPRISPFRLG